MKRIISLFLMLMVLFVISCKKIPENPTRVYETIDSVYDVTVKNTLSNEQLGSITKVNYNRLSVTVSNNAALQDEINSTLDRFHIVIHNISINLYENVLKDIYQIYGESPIYIGCYETYNKNGIFSLKCTVTYSNYGEEATIFLGGASWNLNNGTKLFIDDLLTLSTAELGNFLTMSFSPVVDAYPFYFPQLKVGEKPNYENNLSFYITDESIVMFVCYETYKLHYNFVAIDVAFENYADFFRYDITK